MKKIRVEFLVRKRIREIFVECVDDLVAAYLETIPDDDGEEIYATYREHARGGVEGFARWLKEQVL